MIDGNVVVESRRKPRDYRPFKLIQSTLANLRMVVPETKRAVVELQPLVRHGLMELYT